MHAHLLPYSKMVEFLGEALGDNVEVCLHDLTSPDQEIVAIKNGHISGREVGATLSNLSLHYLEDKVYENKDFVMNYKTSGPDGKLLKSATYFIKEEDEPIGMLCINVDISDFNYLEDTLKKILGIKETSEMEYRRENPIEVLTSPLDEMVDRYMKECLESMGIAPYFQIDRLNVDEKIHLVKYLKEKGTFKVKGAIALVATKLDVSEPTIYRYLKKK